MFAPAQNPAFDLLEPSERHGQFDLAVREPFDLLRWMPLTFAHEPRRERIEVDAHAVPGLALEDAEAVAQMIGNGKVSRATESGSRVPHLAHPGQGERADLPTNQVEAKQIPLILDAAEVVGLNAPRLVPRTAQLLVFKGEFARGEDRPAHRLEKFEVRDAGTDSSERNRRIHVAPVEPDPVLEPFGDLPEGRAQRLLERSAAVLLQRFLGDEERHHFALRHLDVREVRDGLRVNEPEMELVVFDRQPEPVPHEVDVALDRLRGHFQLVGQFSAVWKIAGNQSLVQPHHTLQRRT